MFPILFYVIDNFYLGTYGVLVAIGVLSGIWWATRRAPRFSLSPSIVLDLCFYVILAGIIGGRVFYLLTNWQEVLQDPLSYLFSRSGFVFFGGVIFGFLAGLWFVHRKRLPLWKLGDLVAPCIPLGHFFGRLGCFAAGCCYGKLATGWSAFLGMTFPRVVDRKGELVGSFVYLDHLQRGWLSPEAAFSLPVYPTQLLEAFANLAIFAGLLLIEKRQRFQGQLLLLYLLSYSVLRFLIEILRGDPRGSVWFLSSSQFVAILVVALTLYAWIKLAPRHTSSRGKRRA